jgi:hypothetical protein
MSELPRDDFSAYRRTILQEHLYQLLFKDEDDLPSEILNAPLMPSPWSSFRNGLNFNMYEFRLHLNDLIREVRLSITFSVNL